MTNEEAFLKELSDYLTIDFTEFDKGRVLGYLAKYKETVLEGVPKGRLAPITKVVFKYIERGGLVDNENLRIIEPQMVIDLVTKFSGITEKQMKSRDRYQNLVLARHVAMFFTVKTCHESLLQTGKMFNRDHTSVIHAVRHVRDMHDVGNQKYTNLIDQISMELSIPKEKTA